MCTDNWWSIILLKVFASLSSFEVIKEYSSTLGIVPGIVWGRTYIDIFVCKAWMKIQSCEPHIIYNFQQIVKVISF